MPASHPPACTFHVVQRMAPGGIESVVLDLALADPSVRVLSLEGSREALAAVWPVLDRLGERLIALDKREGVRPGLWRHLAALLRRQAGTAVVTHHIGPLVYAGLAARLAGIGRRVHVEHDGWHYAGPRRRLLGRLADRLVRPRRVAVSQETARQVALALGTAAQVIIPNGVDTDRFRPGSRPDARRAFGLPASARLIGSVGRLERVKGHDVLIEALVDLPADCHVVLAGDGSCRAELLGQAARLGLADRVHFLGPVQAPEALYPAFDLFCLPSRAEGFPRTLIEAQAAGIPVVATDVGGAREAVCPSTGRLAPPERPAELAAILGDALENAARLSPRRFVDPLHSNARMFDCYRALVAA